MNIPNDTLSQDRVASRTDWLVMKNVQAGAISIEHFAASDDQSWCILGANRSGVDQLLHLLSGKISVDKAEHIHIPDNLALVSFSSQQELYEQEVRIDDTDYLDRVDPGTPARNFIGTQEDSMELVRLFRLEHVLDSGYRQLSSGESRKLLLLEAITHGAQHLLIENPYDGLDVESCGDFDRAVARLLKRGITIIIFLASRADVPGWCTHLALFDRGRIIASGKRLDILQSITGSESGEAWAELTRSSLEAGEDSRPEELVKLVAGRARYGNRIIFSGLDLRVERGDHTLISGPNGAGKSTLLALITGDHPDCYTNELYLFGTRRGSGESIWELKKEMGIVSPALHRNHYIPGNTLQIVISGFFDSIGLYRRYTVQQEAQARDWLVRIGLADREKTPFRRLSFGEQRLALIARALIKMPKLLILDEPTQGLDDKNRSNLLAFLEAVAEKKISTILYVSHRRDEYREFFTQNIEMECTT